MLPPVLSPVATEGGGAGATEGGGADDGELCDTKGGGGVGGAGLGGGGTAMTRDISTAGTEAGVSATSCDVVARNDGSLLGGAAACASAPSRFVPSATLLAKVVGRVPVGLGAVVARGGPEVGGFSGGIGIPSGIIIQRRGPCAQVGEIAPL